MTTDVQDYDIAAIRKLLLAAFRPETLYRFCQERPTFRPIVSRFSPGQGCDNMVDEAIDFCETQLLFDELLVAVREVNPRQYKRFAPYRIDKGVPEDEDQLAPDLRGRPKAVGDLLIDDAVKRIRELRTEYGDSNVPPDKLYTPLLDLLHRQSFESPARFCPDRPSRFWKVHLTEKILYFFRRETDNWEDAERSQYRDLMVAVAGYRTRLNILVFGEEGIRLADFNFWVSLQDFKAQLVEKNKKDYPRDKEKDPLWKWANEQREIVVDLVWQIEVELGWRPPPSLLQMARGRFETPTKGL